MPQITLTPAQIAAGLHSGFSVSSGQFTFSMVNGQTNWSADYDAGDEPFRAGFGVLSAAQQAAYRLAIAAWDKLIAPNFVEVTEAATTHGEFRAAFTSIGDSDTAAYAYQTSSQGPLSIAGDIWISSALAGQAFNPGTYNFFLLLHELGHSLGLKHSFEGTPIPAPFENQRYTLMSYSGVSPGSVGGFAAAQNGITTANRSVTLSTPMVLDIAAVQAMYGADPNTAAGNTTYAYVQGSIDIAAIYDAGGTDTIDLASFTRDNIVDLTPGAYSSIGRWTVAEQTAFWQSQFPGYGNFIANQMAGKYEWTDNLGIALNTIIENVVGGSGNDTIIGNAVGNVFFLQRGGSDIVSGGSGGDGFYFGAALGAGDSVDGGAGDDQIALQGNYALTLDAAQTVGVETLVILTGADTRFGESGAARYDYTLATVEANVAAGQRMTVNANSLLAGEDLTFDGRAETDGTFLFYGGKGTDVLTGSQGNDGFFFGNNGQYNVTDRIDGQGGADDQIGLRGDYSAGLVLAATAMTGIETIALLSAADTRFASGGTGFSYVLSTHDDNVAAGARLTISAVTLTAIERLTFDGSAESNGSFRIFGGAGDDIETGGAMADTIFGGNGSDVMTGGLGDDSFVYLTTGNSTPGASDRILDFTIGDRIDLALIDADTLSAGNDGFDFIGGAAFTGGNTAAAAGQLRAAFAGGVWTIEGDTDGNGLADFAIQVTTTAGHAIVAGDFIL